MEQVIKRNKILANGCFDVLHYGHLKLLKECKRLSEEFEGEVCVAINSDESVKKLKGSSRPINNQTKRIEALLDTGLVDSVVLFDTETDLENLISYLKPIFLVKGSDYKDQPITGMNQLTNNGGSIHYIDLIPGLSSTDLLDLQNDKTFLITGAMGFIATNFIKFLNNLGIEGIVCVDYLGLSDKYKNIVDADFLDLIPAEEFKTIIYDSEKRALSYLNNFDYIIHLGGVSDTRVQDLDHVYTHNTKLTNRLIYLTSQIPETKLIYASSAATYGHGYEPQDFTERVKGLLPLNKYGYSKLLSDKFLETTINLTNPRSRIYGLRFFNVYGPYEDYKEDMISAVTKFIKQDKENLKFDEGFKKEDFRILPFTLFKSYKDEFKNGEQSRDFIHVSDVCKVIFHFVLNDIQSGIYNVGTGISTTFNDVCKAINPERDITYSLMPQDLKSIYQYYTCADLTKLRTVAKYTEPFLSVEEGVRYGYQS